jgi:DNA (cytosine-5)-methyltransferase 1
LFKEEKRVKAISLFSGIGGFDLAARECNMNVLAHSEICPRATNVYAKHFPLSEPIGPIESVRASDLPEFQCLFAGWPCQDHSVAGRRVGLAGKRSGLFFEVARILKATTPRWFCCENVPGLLSSDRGRDMRRVVAALTDMGYGVAWRVLDARWFRVPQRRRRVFLVGCFGNPRRAAEVLFECQSLSGDFTPREKTKKEVAGTLTRGFGARGATVDEADSLVPLTGRHAEQLADVPSIAHAINGKGSKFGSGRDAQETFIAHTLTKSHDATEDGSGRGVPLVPASVGVRRLTPLECERVQGFPDYWTESGADGKSLSDSARYSLLGLAVPPTVVTWILQRIMRESKRT